MPVLQTFCPGVCLSPQGSRPGLSVMAARWASCPSAIHGEAGQRPPLWPVWTFADFDVDYKRIIDDEKRHLQEEFPSGRTHAPQSQ